MKLKTLQENPALFCDMLDLLEKIALRTTFDRAAKPGEIRGLGHSQYSHEALAIIERWERLENQNRIAEGKGDKG